MKCFNGGAATLNALQGKLYVGVVVYSSSGVVYSSSWPEKWPARPWILCYVLDI